MNTSMQLKRNLCLFLIALIACLSTGSAAD